MRLGQQLGGGQRLAAEAGNAHQVAPGPFGDRRQRRLFPVPGQIAEPFQALERVVQGAVGDGPPALAGQRLGQQEAADVGVTGGVERDDRAQDARLVVGEPARLALDYASPPIN